MAPQSMKLAAQTVAFAELTDSVRDAMWGIFTSYYDAVTRATFDQDLAKKRDVILLRDSGDGSLRGFSTLTLFNREIGGRRMVAIFSGDTIVDPDYWGQAVLQRAFFSYIIKTKLRHPLRPVYWFLISKGYKTYLLLSRNFPEYWPRHDRATPPWQSQLMAELASSLYPDAWKPELGLLQFPSGMGSLREGLAPIRADMLGHPDIQYFVQKNPAHARGDELCCLGKIDWRLAISYPFKLLRRALGMSRRRRQLAERDAQRS